MGSYRIYLLRMEMPLVTVIIMDTHKTDAELSVLSSGGGVHHRLPDRVDDLRFIRRTIRNKQKRYPAFGLLLFQKHSYHGKTEIQRRSSRTVTPGSPKPESRINHA
jgi:hypothetical protein